MKRSYLKVLVMGVVCIYGGIVYGEDIQQQAISIANHSGHTVKGWLREATGNFFDTATGDAAVDSMRDSNLNLSNGNAIANLEATKQEKLESATQTFQFTVEGILTGFRHAFIEDPQSFKRMIATTGLAKTAQTAANIAIPGSGTAGRLIARGIGNAVGAAIRSAAKAKSVNFYEKISLKNIEDASTQVAEGLITKYGPLILAFEGNRLNDFLGHLAWRVEATGRHLLKSGGALDGQSILQEFSKDQITYRRPAKDRLKSSAKGLIKGSLSKSTVTSLLKMNDQQLAAAAQKFSEPGKVKKAVRAVKGKMKRSKRHAAAPAA